MPGKRKVKPTVPGFPIWWHLSAVLLLSAVARASAAPLNPGTLIVQSQDDGYWSVVENGEFVGECPPQDDGQVGGMVATNDGYVLTVSQDNGNSRIFAIG